MKSVLKTSASVLALAALSLPGLPAFAQEQPGTILVLDASGSMWGQIDGVNKIVIAREVVADILSDFPEDQNLGFVTYGHRERGQCSDIQTVIEPAPGTAPEIVRIVNELNPRGMTPMTDAVIAAAEALRHTEQAATVILVSDGIETCNPDPCAAARALEQAGINFTAHVIGFDVRGEAEALMQMQCIAEETGGRFLTADNAEQLSEALAEVVAAPETGTFTFRANLGDLEFGAEPMWDWQPSPLALPLVEGEVFWEISDTADTLLADGTDNPFIVELPFGEYVVTVRSDDHDSASQIENAFSAGSMRNVHAIFPPALPATVDVSMVAVTGSPDGPRIETPVVWNFDTEGTGFEVDGNPGIAQLHPGEWRVTGYHVAQEREQSTDLTVVAGEAQTHVLVFENPEPTLPPATVSAPQQVVVGSAFAVTWEAEGLNPSDYVTIVPVGADVGAYRSYDRVGEGKTEARLRAPAEPGLYEVRLQTEGKVQVLAVTPIEVVDVEVSVTAPSQAVVGSEFTVSWQAEGLHRDDYVTIVPLGAEPQVYNSYVRLNGNSEGKLRAPAEPGLYEVRVVLDGGRSVLATTPIEVKEASVTVSGPLKVRAGSEMLVAWTGAVNRQDYVTIVPAGMADGQYGPYARVNDADQGKLIAPSEPGLYELRYQLDVGNRVLARQTVEVLAADAPLDDGAGLSVPGSGKVGETILVTWTGGADSADARVALARADQADFSWIMAESAAGRDSLEMILPDTPGTYEIRFLDLEGRAVLGRSIVEVTP